MIEYKTSYNKNSTTTVETDFINPDMETLDALKAYKEELYQSKEMQDYLTIQEEIEEIKQEIIEDITNGEFKSLVARGIKKEQVDKISKTFQNDKRLQKKQALQRALAYKVDKKMGQDLFAHPKLAGFSSHRTTETKTRFFITNKEEVYVADARMTLPYLWDKSDNLTDDELLDKMIQTAGSRNSALAEDAGIAIPDGYPEDGDTLQTMQQKGANLAEPTIEQSEADLTQPIVSNENISENQINPEYNNPEFRAWLKANNTLEYYEYRPELMPEAYKAWQDEKNNSPVQEDKNNEAKTAEVQSDETQNESKQEYFHVGVDIINKGGKKRQAEMTGEEENESKPATTLIIHQGKASDTPQKTEEKTEEKSAETPADEEKKAIPEPQEPTKAGQEEPLTKDEQKQTKDGESQEEKKQNQPQEQEEKWVTDKRQSWKEWCEDATLSNHPYVYDEQQAEGLKFDVYKTPADKEQGNKAASIHYTKPNEVTLETKEGQVPDFEFFDKLVLEAKKDGIPSVTFDGEMTPEFQARLAAACVKHGLTMKGSHPKEIDQNLLGVNDAALQKQVTDFNKGAENKEKEQYYKEAYEQASAMLKEDKKLDRTKPIDLVKQVEGKQEYAEHPEMVAMYYAAYKNAGFEITGADKLNAETHGMFLTPDKKLFPPEAQKAIDEFNEAAKAKKMKNLREQIDTETYNKLTSKDTPNDERNKIIDKDISREKADNYRALLNEYRENAVSKFGAKLGLDPQDPMAHTKVSFEKLTDEQLVTAVGEGINYLKLLGEGKTSGQISINDIDNVEIPEDTAEKAKIIRSGLTAMQETLQNRIKGQSHLNTSLLKKLHERQPE